MRNKDKIENFAFNCGRPFSSEEAAELCGVSLNRTKAHILTLRKEGKVKIQRKVINKHFYIWKEPAKTIKIKTSPASVETGDKIEEIITADGFTSLRDIAKRAGCSYECVRQVIIDRGLSNVNIEKVNRKQEKGVRKDLLHVLKAGKKVMKEQSQRPFLESITPFGVRG